MQHSTPVPTNLENNLIDSLTSTYILPLTSPQNMPHLSLCSVKGGTMIDSGGPPGVHCSGHYIMPSGPVPTVDYGPSLTNATNLGMWDTPQIVPANQVINNKKVKEKIACFLIINNLLKFEI